MADVLTSCDPNDPFTASYMEYVIMVPLFFLIQLYQLISTIHYEVTHRHVVRKHPGDPPGKTVMILYLTLQLMALIWTITYIFKFVIDPHIHIDEDNIPFGCKLVAHIPKHLIAPYYITYLYYIFLRLTASFKNSYLELSNRNINILRTMIIIPIALTHLIYIILTVIAANPVCIRSWIPKDYDYPTVAPDDNTSDFKYCDLPTHPQAIIAYGIALGWICTLNTVFGVIFCYKLNKLLTSSTGNEDVGFQFKSLIVKIAILTLSGSISTMFSYLFWLRWGKVIFLHLDLVVNCITIGLMFKYNEKWYKRLCRFCIILCFANCDRSSNKMTEENIMQYVNTFDVVDLDEIFKMIDMDQMERKNNRESKETIEIDPEPGANKKNLIRVSSLGDIVSDVDNNDAQDIIDMINQ